MSLIIPYIFPLKDYLFKLLPHPTSPDYYIIQPKPFYYRMTANHSQELFLLFREFVKDIHKISRKVLNNKINLSNLGNGSILPLRKRARSRAIILSPEFSLSSSAIRNGLYPLSTWHQKSFKAFKTAINPLIFGSTKIPQIYILSD